MSLKMPKILLLGANGKMGTAISKVFNPGWSLIPVTRNDCDAVNHDQVRSLVSRHSPDVVVNTIAFLGIDPCEEQPEMAFKMNSLFPKFLAELSNELNFTLIHFSTDAVFNDLKGDFYLESDPPSPINVYGMTKLGGDCFVRGIALKHYLIRISVLFGETAKETQFVEKMLSKYRQGQKVWEVSSDIIGSPSYSLDIAGIVKSLLETNADFGLYHIANKGKASLFDLMKEIANNLHLNVTVSPVSFRNFSFRGIKNTLTPISSEKLPPLRPWQDAVHDYCCGLNPGKEDRHGG